MKSLSAQRASCSMKSLSAQRASMLVACSPVFPASQLTGSLLSSGVLTISWLALSCLSQLHMLLLSLLSPSIYLIYASLWSSLCGLGGTEWNRGSDFNPPLSCLGRVMGEGGAFTGPGDGTGGGWWRFLSSSSFTFLALSAYTCLSASVICLHLSATILLIP